MPKTAPLSATLFKKVYLYNEVLQQIERAEAFLALGQSSYEFSSSRFRKSPSLETMGAVRAIVKLTNAVDDELVRRGLLNPNRLRQIEAEGLVDTGAVSLVIPEQVVQELGLRILGRQIAKYADGREAPVDVTGPLMIECLGQQNVDQALVTGDEVLIGQVILEKLDLLPDYKNQRLIPNPEHPDYPVAIIK